MSDKTNPKSQRSDDAIAWSVVYKFAKSKDIEIGDSDMSTEQLLEKIWDESFNLGFEYGYQRHDSDHQEQR
jgi:hypothetical protein